MNMSFFKLGSLISYIPRSVNIGFTSGIAVIIFSGQIENFLGVEDVEKKEYFHKNMMEIVNYIDTINMFSFIVPLIGFASVIILLKIFLYKPVLNIYNFFPPIPTLFLLQLHVSSPLIE